MNTLGNLGNFYIVLLVMVLIGGVGLISLNFSKKYWGKMENYINTKGGKSMNKWFKLAVTSFVGIIIASFALGLTNSSSAQEAQGGHGHAGTSQAAVGGPADAQQVNYSAQNNGMQPNDGSIYDNSAQMRQIEMNMMQLQQQMAQVIQMHNNGLQYGSWGGNGFQGQPQMNNGPGMYNPGPVNGTNSGMSGAAGTSNSSNMSSGSMNSQSNSGGSSGGGMSMM